MDKHMFVMIRYSVLTESNTAWVPGFVRKVISAKFAYAIAA